MKRQLGHLSLTAPTGNHVIESHSLCDCHFVDDRFPQNSHNTRFNMSQMATPVSPDRGIHNHPSGGVPTEVLVNFRSKSCIKFARAAARTKRVKNYLQADIANGYIQGGLEFVVQTSRGVVLRQKIRYKKIWYNISFNLGARFSRKSTLKFVCERFSCLFLYRRDSVYKHYLMCD